MNNFIISTSICLFCFTITICCNAQLTTNSKLNYREIILKEFRNDTCLIIKSSTGDSLSFYREFDIIENTFEDTIVIGYGVIPPRFTGHNLFYSQVGNNKKEFASLPYDVDYIRYLRNSNSSVYTSKSICIFRHSENKTEDDGNKILKLRVKLPSSALENH